MPAFLFLAMAILTTPPQYEELPLSEVRLTASVFQQRRDANRKYLLHLEPQRLLHNFYKNAGLPTHGEIYGGWESQGVAGHTLGHYLSAISLQIASTGDPELKAREREIVEALALCQAKRGSGYVGGIPNEDVIWSEIRRSDVRSQGFDLNGGWVPWYTVHKLFAGLLDAYRLTGDKQALTVVSKLGDWAVELLKDMDEPTFQRMLACEHGGMIDALAQLSEATGDARYLKLAQRFFHHAILDPLVEGRDELAGKHANTQIPKVIGLVNLSWLTGDKSLLEAGKFFWERVTQHHSYVIGGNSDHEHFGPSDELSGRLSTNTCETCNTYNMLKLSKVLFEATGDWRYMDYYEHALVNHILASQDPADGMVCYYVSLLPGTERAYSTPDDSFWCCVGTGIENHAKYGETVAFRKGSGLAIANYIPSEIQDAKTGFTLKIESNYPSDGDVQILIEKAPSEQAALEFRVPPYAKEITAQVNGGPEAPWKGHTGTIDRLWHAGDTVRFNLNFGAVRQEPMPDNPDRVAFVQGPNVLCASLSGDLPSHAYDIVGSPSVVADANGNLELEATSGHPATPMKPFWQATHDKTVVYFDLFSSEKWKVEQAKRDAERAALADIEKRTIDALRPGEMQDERDHHLAGEKTDAGDNGGRKWRHAVDGGWFSFTLSVDPKAENQLIITLFGLDGAGREYDVLIDGQLLKSYAPDGSKGALFYDDTTTIPQSLTAGKQQVTVRFQAHPGKMAGGLYGARILRPQS